MQRFVLFMLAMLMTSLILAQAGPELVGPGVISTGSDYCTTLSPDGKLMCFARSTPEGRDIIMRSQWLRGAWSSPEKVNFSGKFSDTDPMLSPDGNTFFFMTNRTPEEDGEMDDYDIWAVDKEKLGWGKPYRLPDYINTSFNEGFPSINTKGDLYFFRSNRNGHTEQDIWFAPKVGGGFDQPVKVRGGVNSANWDGHPFVSPQDDFMVFYSSREGGFGRCDLYISFKKEGNWQAPQNLGNNINSGHCEMVPFVSADQKTLYFSRIENDQRNIYQVDFQPLLKALFQKKP